jgi:hypothetical protein
MKWLGNIESIDTLQLLDDKIYDKKITVISRKSKIEFLVAKGFKRVNYAVFEDKDLTFASGINIGMAKMEFAKKIDPNYDSCILKYNFYKNYDPPGVSVDQTFIFKNEVLIKIIFKTPR